MPSVLPALKGRLGSTEYYIVTMKAKELVERLTIPKDMDGWDDLSVEERFQRDIDVKRVKRDIAPYFAADPDRFFGALIVAARNVEEFQFEAINDIAKGLPGLYKVAAQGIGFLNLSGGEVMIPLDGQHRLMAVRYAITGRDEVGVPIDGIDANMSLAQEDVTVLLIKFETEKARKIFNKVNRYARPTSRAQNLLTDDDDFAAILTREMADQLIGSRLVNLTSNSLNKQSEQFTTLSMLYDSVELIIKSKGHKVEKSHRLPKSQEAVIRADVRGVWTRLVNEIDLFAAALADQEESGDAKRREIRQETLLGKPIGQLALVGAYLRLEFAQAVSGKKINEDEACARLNGLDWSVTAPHWQRVLMFGDKVATGRSAASFGMEWISYLAGESLSNVQLESLLSRYRQGFPQEEQDLIVLPEPLTCEW